MSTSNILGAWGEKQAEKFLTQRGFSVLQRNYHSRYGEIDLIMENAEFLIFVEVKLRKNSRFGTPAEAVTVKKQERLRKTALLYLQTHATKKQPRFDVIEIYAPKGMDTVPLPISHIENAF